MTASLATLAGQTADRSTGLGVVLTQPAETSHVYPQRGSTVPVRLGLPLFCRASELEAVFVRSRSSWSIIGPRHTEYWLELSLRPEAAKRLGELSQQRVDARVALLVRGEVVGVIALSEPVGGRKVTLYGFSDRNGAEVLAEELKQDLRASQ